MSDGAALPHVVTSVVPDLPVPPAALFEAAEAAPLTRAAHDQLALDLPAFNAVEFRPAPPRDVPSGPIRVAAWNAERLKHAGPSVELVRASDADILLLSETDRGMARSGNRHTAADLAAALGMGYVYGVEFLELGIGDSREREWHRGASNTVGFHGNAILSRLPFSSPALIRLDDGAVWWLDAQDGERRLGFRMAIAARIETRAGPIVAVVAHLESKSDAEDRARQMRRLTETIDTLHPGLPVIIGGDLNTKSLPSEAADWLATPREEPLFAIVEAKGFDWRLANTAEPTQRTLPDGAPLPPFRRIDWLLARDLEASDPATLEAVDDDGLAISDHDLIAAEIRLR